MAKRRVCYSLKTKLIFHGTKRSAKLFTLGGGHSYCDAILYIPEERVVFMGDLVFVDCHPTFFDESNPENWIDILKKVKGMDIDVAIPGHGPIGRKIHLTKVINYINELMEIARERNEIEDSKLPNNYKNWSSPEIFQQNLKILKDMLD